MTELHQPLPAIYAMRPVQFFELLQTHFTMRAEAARRAAQGRNRARR